MARKLAVATLSLNDATRILDEYSDRIHLTDDVSLALVRRALEVVYLEANK